MSIRAFAASWSVLLLLLSRSGLAQSADVDEFDLGNEWVDSGNEGGWFAPWTPLLTPDTGTIRLDLSGGIGIDRSQRARPDVLDSGHARRSARQDYYALATLEVPLDRLFPGGRASSRGSWGSRKDEQQLLAQYEMDEPEGRSRGAADAGVGSSLLDVPSSRTNEPHAVKEGSPDAPPDRAETDAETGPHGENGAAAYDSPSAQGRDDVAMDDPQQLFPSDETTQVAREIAGRVAAALDGADGRMRSLIRRSRWSGLSPELRLRGVLGFDRATSREESVGIYAGDTTVRGGRDSLAEVRLTFRLDRLVLGDGESTLERQRIELAKDRRKLIKEALDLFSDWRLSHVRAQDVSLSPDERLVALIDAESALAELHLLTDGWFQGIKTLRQLARESPNAGRSGSEAARGR